MIISAKSFFNLAILVFGCLPIIFIGDAAWSALKKRRHWIPAGSLVVGALVIQFLSLLDKSFNFPCDVFAADHESKIKGFFKDYADDYDVEIPPSQNISDDHYYIFLILYSNWVSVVCGRVSMFVLMGCLLPGVARPLSGNVWRDMAALFISSSLSLFHISYETFRIAKLAFCIPKLLDFTRLFLAMATQAGGSTAWVCPSSCHPHRPIRPPTSVRQCHTLMDIDNRTNPMI